MCNAFLHKIILAYFCYLEIKYWKDGSIKRHFGECHGSIRNEMGPDLFSISTWTPLALVFSENSDFVDRNRFVFHLDGLNDWKSNKLKFSLLLSLIVIGGQQGNPANYIHIHDIVSFFIIVRTVLRIRNVSFFALCRHICIMKKKGESCSHHYHIMCSFHMIVVSNIIISSEIHIKKYRSYQHHNNAYWHFSSSWHAL